MQIPCVMIEPMWVSLKLNIAISGDSGSYAVSQTTLLHIHVEHKNTNATLQSFHHMCSKYMYVTRVSHGRKRHKW